MLIFEKIYMSSHISIYINILSSFKIVMQTQSKDSKINGPIKENKKRDFLNF